jgi:hypothetical protein
MIQRRLTIDLPGSPEARHNVLQVLIRCGLISEKKARSIEQGDKIKSQEKKGTKSRWARTAEIMSSQGYLKGRTGELIESIRDFRDDFEIPNPLSNAK